MNRIAIALGLIIWCGLGIWWLCVRHLEKLGAARDLAMEGHPTVEQMVDLLRYKDETVLANTLTSFEFSGSDAGRQRAAELLDHSNTYVWYCACLYLGSIGDQRAVPSLIRGLDHPAWRSRDRVVRYLRELTRQDFGEDKEQWIRWWKSQNPSATFDFQVKRS